MIRYFEKQLSEFEHCIHSLDEQVFDRWVRESVETLERLPSGAMAFLSLSGSL